MSYWIIVHKPTGRVLPARDSHQFNACPSNRELQAGVPPRLYPSRSGANSALKRWLLGRPGHSAASTTILFGGGQASSTFDDVKKKGLKTRRIGQTVYVEEPTRTAIADEIAVVEVVVREITEEDRDYA